MKKRVFISLVCNVLKATIGFLLSIYLARVLSVEDYGRYNYITGILIAWFTFSDCGMGQAFFTFISKKVQSAKFYKCYIFWVLAIFLIPLCLLYLITYLYKLHVTTYVVAFVAVFGQQQVINFLSSLAESIKKTKDWQIINLIFVFSNFLVILLVSQFTALTIELIYGVIVCNLILITFLFYAIIGREYIGLIKRYSGDEAPYKEFYLKFWGFSKPLLFVLFIGSIQKFVTPYTIDYYGGDEQQAYYSVGFKLATISLIFVNSVLKIFWREFSNLVDRGDVTAALRLYSNILVASFFLTISLATFLYPMSKEILSFIYGNKYLAAIQVFQVMLFYPVYQCLGQFTGAMYLALEETRLYSFYSSISGILTTISICVFSYLFSAHDISLIVACVLLFNQVVVINALVKALPVEQKTKFTFIYQITVFSISFIVYEILYSSLVNSLDSTVLIFFVYTIVSLLLMCMLGFLFYKGRVFYHER